jgi:hypothetical protein
MKGQTLKNEDMTSAITFADDLYQLPKSFPLTVGRREHPDQGCSNQPYRLCAALILSFLFRNCLWQLLLACPPGSVSALFSSRAFSKSSGTTLEASKRSSEFNRF